MSVRRTFGLGTLDIRGDRVEYRPAPKLVFEAEAGDEAQVGVTYGFVEASPQKESGRLVLTLDFAGTKKAAEVRLTELPLVQSDARGFLAHTISLSEAGEIEGAYAVEAVMKAGPWLGGGQTTTADFRREGKFTVKVR